MLRALFRKSTCRNKTKSINIRQTLSLAWHRRLLYLRSASIWDMLRRSDVKHKKHTVSWKEFGKICNSPDTRNNTAVTIIAGTTFQKNPIREIGTAAMLHSKTTMAQEMMLFCISGRSHDMHHVKYIRHKNLWVRSTFRE